MIKFKPHRNHKAFVLKLLSENDLLRQNLRENNRLLKLLDSQTPLDAPKARTTLHWTQRPENKARIDAMLQKAHEARLNKRVNAELATQAVARMEAEHED
jgi:hypothetical protein